MLAFALLCVSAALPAWGQQATVAGIVEGNAVLIRQTTRYALQEGVELRGDDIVETQAGAFIQLEFGDGTLIGVGESSRLLLQPRVARNTNAARLYLLTGWLKVTPMQTPAFDLLTPGFDLATQAASVVVRVPGPSEYEVFLETGTAKLFEREGTRATLGLKAGDFASHPKGAQVSTVGGGPTGEFLKALPRPFRDRLPARAPLYAGRNPPPKPLGEVSYADVAAWLRSESAIRQPLSRQWRPRASDKAFRAEVQANIAQHMEWEPVVFPERFVVKKKPPEAPKAEAPKAEAPKPEPSAAAAGSWYRAASQPN